MACLGMLYYFSNKLAVQKRQIFVLKKQYNDFKNAKTPFAKGKIEIKYVTPDISSSTIYTNCNLFISPLKNSPLIRTLEKGTFITLIDSAEINNEKWYEVSIDTIDNINSKGWIQSKYIESN